MSSLERSENGRPIFPSMGVWKGHRIRVLYYIGRGNFMVLDHKDDKRVLHRNQFNFIKL
jgi:hypothetical protein